MMVRRTMSACGDFFSQAELGSGVSAGAATGPVLKPQAQAQPSLTARTRVPPVSAHVGYITVQGATGTSPRSRSLTPRDTARATWKLACSWGKCSTAQPRSTPTHDRHTQGSPWYVGGGHARAGTRSRTDTLAHGHARARNGHARAHSRDQISRGCAHTSCARTRPYPVDCTDLTTRPTNPPRLVPAMRTSP